MLGRLSESFHSGVEKAMLSDQQYKEYGGDSQSLHILAVIADHSPGVRTVILETSSKEVYVQD